MYEIEKQHKNKGQVNFDSSNSVNKLLSGFLVFLTISVGFGFLLGRFVFPKSCTNCETVVEEVRTDGNAYIDFVSGTEYIANIGGLDTGQVIVRVVDYKGRPLNATCNATILNPDKTYYMTDQLMSPSSIDGNYYTTFSIPSTTGIFEDYVNCSVQLGGRTLHVTKSSSFHVSPILNLFDNISTQISDLNDTVVDGNNMLNNTINYVHTDIINELGNIEVSFNASLNQIINDMATYYSNLDMKIDNAETTILNALDDCCDDLLREIGKYKSDIEIIKEWLSYIFAKAVPTEQLEEGEYWDNWLERIIGKDVDLPDLRIPRPD